MLSPLQSLSNSHLAVSDPYQSLFGSKAMPRSLYLAAYRGELEGVGHCNCCFVKHGFGSGKQKASEERNHKQDPY